MKFASYGRHVFGADAAQILLPNTVAIASPNGAKAADKADWSPLSGREVYVWPDMDDPGLAYAADVVRLASLAGASVKLISFNRSFPKGWDAADALAEGFTEEKLIGIMSW